MTRSPAIGAATSVKRWSSIRCTPWPCWSARPARSIKRRPSPGGRCRRRFSGCGGGWRPRLGKAGTREYVQVLRLLEDFRLDHVSGAVGDALALGAIGFDAVQHLVLCRLDHRPPRLDLAQYPHLPAARVAMMRRRITWRCWGRAPSDGETDRAARRASQGAATADLFARVRQSGAAVAAKKGWTVRALCYDSASWSCSIASSAPPSGASRPPSSRS